MGTGNLPELVLTGVQSRGEVEQEGGREGGNEQHVAAENKGEAGYTD